MFLFFQAHPWLKGIKWDALYEMEAAYKPTVNGDLDTQNFEKFTEVSCFNSVVLLYVLRIMLVLNNRTLLLFDR